MAIRGGPWYQVRALKCKPMKGLIIPLNRLDVEVVLLCGQAATASDKGEGEERVRARVSVSVSVRVRARVTVG